MLFIPPLYICYSLHPAIGIQLTLACLIRVRQRKRKTKGLSFFFWFFFSFRFPPHVLSLLPTPVVFPPFPLTPQSAGSQGDSANWFVKSHSVSHDNLRSSLWQVLQMTGMMRQLLRLCSYLHLQCECVHSSWDCELIVSWIIYLFGAARLAAIFPFTALWFAYPFIYLKLYYISKTLHMWVVNTESVRINYATSIDIPANISAGFKV